MPWLDRVRRTLLLSLSLGLPASAAPMLATVVNQSTTTACAEEDNVSVAMSGPRIAAFRVEALQPAYLARIERDTTAPDFSGCNFDGGTHPTDPAFDFKPGRVVLHDGPRWRIVGITLARFWRPQRVPVTVDGHTVHGIHLLQVFARTADGAEPKEALVMYPSDGSWRLKPLPEARFGDGVYGSTFLLGPVTQARRPVVDIASIAVATQPLALRLRFADGGQAQVKVAEISRRRTALDVVLRPAAARGRPFAVLRSMYVQPDNADVSELHWRAVPGAVPTVTALPALTTLQAMDLRFGRSLPSRHNTSAPDIRFSGFASMPKR
jgi:hypothetical protein